MRRVFGGVSFAIVVKDRKELRGASERDDVACRDSCLELYFRFVYAFSFRNRVQSNLKAQKRELRSTEVLHNV